jgi:hypothetical protein
LKLLPAKGRAQDHGLGLVLRFDQLYHSWISAAAISWMMVSNLSGWSATAYLLVLIDNDYFLVLVTLHVNSFIAGIVNRYLMRMAATKMSRAE